MKTKRGFLSLQVVILAAVMVLNCLLFYMMHCSGEYLQSTDVWGHTQTVSHSGFQNRLRMLKVIPADTSAALTQAEQTIERIEEAEEKVSQSRNKVERVQKESQAELDALLSTVGNKEDYEALTEILSDVISYESEIVQLGEKAHGMSQTALYSDGWYLGNIAKTERDYYGLEYVTVSPVQDNAWNAVINFAVSDVLAAGLSVIMAALLLYFLKNREEQMLSGISGVVIKTGIITALGVIGIYGSSLLMKELLLEANQFSVSIQSLESFRTCQYELTIGGFTAIWLILKLSFFVFLFCGALALLTMEQKKRRIWVVLLPVVLLAEFLLARYPGDAPVLVFFREINVFSALNPERFFNRYLNLNIAGGAYSRLPLFLVFWVILVGTTVVFCVRRMGSFHRYALAVLQQNYDAEISRQYTEMRQIWHDFQNHLLTIQALNESGDREGADHYIKDLNESILKNQLAAKTGCTPVDLLLYKKQQLARELETSLRLTIQCRLVDMKFAAYDLCSVLGNLLDNALEACAELPLDGRSVELELKQQQGMLLISCKNPYAGERRGDNGKFASTKEEKSGHGIGLSSVRQVCKKYQGTMEISAENQVFRVHLLLMEKQ